LQSTVLSVAAAPDPSSFMQGDVKNYSVICSLPADAKQLRLGMTAEAEILVTPN
jgi:hypothetical protein